MKLTGERIEQIRHLAEVQKVEGMLIQEWELVALCELALRHAAPPASPSVAPADSEFGSAAGPAVAAPSSTSGDGGKDG